jgi:hypothetical protein
MNASDWKRIEDGGGEIGGRSLEIDQLVSSFILAIRDSFGPNEVPGDVMALLPELREHGQKFHGTIKGIAKLMYRTVPKRG